MIVIISPLVNSRPLLHLNKQGCFLKNPCQLQFQKGCVLFSSLWFKTYILLQKTRTLDYFETNKWHWNLWSKKIMKLILLTFCLQSFILSPFSFFHFSSWLYQGKIAAQRTLQMIVTNAFTEMLLNFMFKFNIIVTDFPFPFWSYLYIIYRSSILHLCITLAFLYISTLISFQANIERD